MNSLGIKIKPYLFLRRASLKTAMSSHFGPSSPGASSEDEKGDEPDNRRIVIFRRYKASVG